MRLGFRLYAFQADASGFRVFPKFHEGKAIIKAVLMVERWLERARERRNLAQLDDRALFDVGLSRSEAANESGKMFWQE